MTIEGAGDGSENGVENGRVAVCGPDEASKAEWLLLSAVTSDLTDLVTPEQRRNT